MKEEEVWECVVVVVWTCEELELRRQRGVGKKGSYVGSHHEQENANQPAGERTGGLARELHGSSGRSLVPFWLDGWRESEGKNLGREDASTGG